MESALIQKLQKLNQTYKTDCKVKFIDSDHSYYYKGVITLGLESKDPVWTLCHEFKHFLQDSKRNYLYLLKYKIVKRSIWYGVAAVLFYYLLAQGILVTGQNKPLHESQIWIIVYLFLFSILMYPPLIGTMQALCKELNHHLEFEADSFASKNSGVIPYKSVVKEDEETISHPSWHSRIITLEEVFPDLKK